MDDYLAKPLRLKTLTAALARWAPQSAPVTVVDDPAKPDPSTGRGLTQRPNRASRCWMPTSSLAWNAWARRQEKT